MEFNESSQEQAAHIFFKVLCHFGCDSYVILYDSLILNSNGLALGGWRWSEKVTCFLLIHPIAAPLSETGESSSAKFMENNTTQNTQKKTESNSQKIW